MGERDNLENQNDANCRIFHLRSSWKNIWEQGKRMLLHAYLPQKFLEQDAEKV